MFGGFSGEMLFASARPVIPSAVTRISPDLGRATQTSQIHAKSSDARIPLTDRLGVNGEFFHGQTIASYNGAVVQNFNRQTKEGIRSTGAWGEVYIYWTPCLHSHFGYGIDDPLDEDLSPGQVSRNEFYFGNIIWDITRSLDVGFELSYRETTYIPQEILESVVLQDNDAMIYHGRVRIKF